jgi:hypothetical protein
MAKKKKNKSKKRLTSWEKIRDKRPIDERKIAAYGRLMEAEDLLYELWEQRGTGMNWIGEALGAPVEEDELLWMAGLGEKVAALGGHLELVAVFPDESVTLVREPGLEGDSEK